MPQPSPTEAVRARVDLRNERIALVAKALTNPVRIRLLALLAQRPLHVDALAEHLELPRGNTSAQLKSLEAAGLVRVHKDGRRRIYDLAGDSVRQLLAALQAATAELDPHFRELYTKDVRASTFDVARARKLAAQLAAGTRTAWDFRSPQEYAHAHVAGAVNVALDDLAAGRLDGVPGPVLLYCRGRFCLTADEATRLARSRGLEVVDLDGSVQDWEQAGLPVERG